jgi:hypothetical protein
MSPLSPAAQRELSELGAAAANSSDWLSDYLAMLKNLADRDTSDVTEWEIKGRGIEVLEKAREKYRIAVELKAYAITQIPADISAALAKLPESATLEEFLEGLMPHISKGEQRERVIQFLSHRYEECVDEQMELHPRKISRDERIAQMARDELETWEHNSLSQESQYWLHKDFKAWWIRLDEGNPLTKTNETSTRKKAEKMDAMLGLLPHNKRANQTISLDEWRKRAKQRLGIPSSTFDIYRKELKPRFTEQPKWRFRVDIANTSEKM